MKVLYIHLSPSSVGEWQKFLMRVTVWWPIHGPFKTTSQSLVLLLMIHLLSPANQDSLFFLVKSIYVRKKILEREEKVYTTYKNSSTLSHQHHSQTTDWNQNDNLKKYPWNHNPVKIVLFRKTGRFLSNKKNEKYEYFPFLYHKWKSLD